MLYGFIDESGTPGVANSDMDFLAASLVVCESLDAVEKIESKMAHHRIINGLPPDYEFHCSSNSTKQQEKFVELMAKMNFRFITVAIRKNTLSKTATYEELAELLLEKIMKLEEPIKIKIDVNPILCKTLNQLARSIRPRRLWAKEVNSKSVDLLQVADYVVNISVKKLKGRKNGERWYPKIKNKRIT